MRIPAVEAYTNQYITENDDPRGNAREINGVKNPDEEMLYSPDKVSGDSSGSLLTQSERDFFINMFPENSEQLSRHVLFNRNGRLQTPNIAKGSLIDGRV